MEPLLEVVTAARIVKQYFDLKRYNHPKVRILSNKMFEKSAESDMKRLIETLTPCGVVEFVYENLFENSIDLRTSGWTEMPIDLKENDRKFSVFVDVFGTLTKKFENEPELLKSEREKLVKKIEKCQKDLKKSELNLQNFLENNKLTEYETEEEAEKEKLKENKLRD